MHESSFMILLRGRSIVLTFPFVVIVVLFLPFPSPSRTAWAFRDLMLSTIVQACLRTYLNEDGLMCQCARLPLQPGPGLSCIM